MISIALATFNGEKYLRKQLDSIINQSIKDIEIIVSDDCSTDRTLNILKEYSTKDQRIHIYTNTENCGFLRNFEKALSRCQGEYIALCDQDDIWMSDHLECLITQIKDKILVCGNSLFIDENDNELGMTLKYQEALDYIPENDLKKAKSIYLFRNPYQGATMLIKRQLLNVALPIPQHINFHDSWLAFIACFYGGINYVDKPLIKYRRNSKSVTGLRNKRKSKFWHFRNHIIWNDRIYFAVNVLQRCNNLDYHQTHFLYNMIQMYKRNNTKYGKIKNILYKLLYYKDIYSCDLKHWL